MNEKYIWHFNDEYIEWSSEYLENFKSTFDYKNYILPHSDMRELLGRIIEEFQYLEHNINHLLIIAVENNIYQGNTNFNFDNFIPSSKIINNLKGVLIEEHIAEDLIKIMKFRNYLIHEYYVKEDKSDTNEKMPLFLFMIFESIDYISNVTNRIIGGATHIPNIFEVK